MKTLLKGLARAKGRTIINALIILLATVAVGVVLAAPIGIGDKQDFANNNQTSNIQKSSSTENSSSESSETAITQNSNSDNESSSQQIMMGQKPNGGNFNTTKAIILAGIAIVGAGLLILVNLVSTNRRKEEIEQIHANGISMSDIKKQFFKEALLTVLVVGIIGSAVATFVSKPIANTVFSNGISSSEMGAFGGKCSTPPSLPGGDNGNMQPPSDNNSSANSNSENSSTDNSFGNNNSNGFPSGNMPQGGPIGEHGGNNHYLLIALATLGYTVVLSLVAGVFCALPIKTDKTDNNIYISEISEELEEVTEEKNEQEKTEQ